MTLRVGIVSAAWGAFAHLPAWRAIPGVEVTAICTSRRETAEAAAARHGIARPFWDALALCRDPDIDIVDLGTRPAIRLPMVLEALAHHKHVYNSCPHAPDWAGARAIDAAWNRTRSHTAVDAYSRWLPALMRLREMLEQGHCGQLLGGHAHFTMSLFNRPDPHFPYIWFANRAAGVSALRNFGSHLLFVLIELLGPVAEVVADERIALPQWTFADGRAITPENPDCANLILRFASGISLTLQASWVQSAQAGFAIDLFGTDGRLRAAAPSFPTVADCTLEAGLAGARAVPSLVPVPLDLAPDPAIALDPVSNPPPAWPMARSMHALVRAIRGEGAPVPDFALACQVEAVLEAARISAAEGRWAKVPEPA